MKQTAFGIMLAGLVMASDMAAADNSFRKAAWIEGGATVKGAYSVAVGVRLGPVGIKAGYGGESDYLSNQVYDAHPFSPGELGVQAASLGRKRIDPAVGFDFMGFYEISKNLTAYAEAGPYFQEVREVMVVTGYQGFNPWLVGTLFNSERKRYNLTLEGGAGVQYRIPYNNWRAVLITAGYHTMRGISAGIGLAF